MVLEAYSRGELWTLRCGHSFRMRLRLRVPSRQYYMWWPNSKVQDEARYRYACEMSIRFNPSSITKDDGVYSLKWPGPGESQSALRVLLQPIYIYSTYTYYLVKHQSNGKRRFHSFSYICTSGLGSLNRRFVLTVEGKVHESTSTSTSAFIAACTVCPQLEVTGKTGPPDRPVCKGR